VIRGTLAKDLHVLWNASIAISTGPLKYAMLAKFWHGRQGGGKWSRKGGEWKGGGLWQIQRANEGRLYGWSGWMVENLLFLPLALRKCVESRKSEGGKVDRWHGRVFCQNWCRWVFVNVRIFIKRNWRRATRTPLNGRKSDRCGLIEMRNKGLQNLSLK